MHKVPVRSELRSILTAAPSTTKVKYSVLRLNSRSLLKIQARLLTRFYIVIIIACQSPWRHTVQVNHLNLSKFDSLNQIYTYYCYTMLKTLTLLHNAQHFNQLHLKRVVPKGFRFLREIAMLFFMLFKTPQKSLLSKLSYLRTY